jgi:hypothetical protein
MTISRVSAVATVALALMPLASTAGAQLVNGQWQLSPRTSGVAASSKGVARSPQQGVVIVEPSHMPVHQRSVFPRRPVQFTYIPAVLMSDGSVFADFGFGYEPVTRACSGNLVLPRRQRLLVRGGASRQIPTYTQPVPNQPSPSQLMVQRATGQQVSTVSRSSCFARDGAGNLVALR